MPEGNGQRGWPVTPARRGRVRCSPSGEHRLVSENPLYRRGETPARGCQSPAWAHRTCPMTSAELMQSPAGPMDLDKPLYTLSIAAEILEIHPRTRMMYEALTLVIPERT